MLTLKIEEDGYESNLQPLDIFHACWLLISHSLLSLLGNCAMFEMLVLSSAQPGTKNQPIAGCGLTPIAFHHNPDYCRVIWCKCE